MATKRFQDAFVRTSLRVPPVLHAAVHARTESTGRTFNAEVLNLIEQGLQEAPAALESMARGQMRENIWMYAHIHIVGVPGRNELITRHKISGDVNAMVQKLGESVKQNIAEMVAEAVAQAKQ